jgi:hypothetical protein
MTPPPKSNNFIVMEAKMLARVVTAQGKPEKVDEVIRYFQETTLPAAKRIKGFNKGFMMVNRQTGKIIAMVHWENQQSIQDSNALAGSVIPQMVKISGATQAPTVDIYEVAVTEVATPGGMK